MGSRKRQVMSPTMALVPTRPFTFSSLLRSQHLLLLLVLGLLTGTDNVPTLLSLAHFTNRLSRAESLFTTALCTHFTTTYCGFNFAAACTNAFTIVMIVIILDSVSPLGFYPPLCGQRVPGHAGGEKQMAGGSRESHLTIKQTRNTRVLVLPLLLLLTHFHTHTSTHNLQRPSLTGLVLVQFGGVTVSGGFIDWFHWQFPHNCLYECEIKRKMLLAKNSLFPRSVRTTSLEENGGK